MSGLIHKPWKVTLIDLTKNYVSQDVIDDLIKEARFSQMVIPLYRGLTVDPRAIALSVINITKEKNQVVGLVEFSGIGGKYLKNHGLEETMQIKPLFMGTHTLTGGGLKVTKVLGFSIDQSQCPR